MGKMVTSKLMIVLQNLAAYYQEALVKIKSVIRSGIKEKSDLLSERILILRKSDQDQTSSSLSAIQLAVTNLTLTKIDYQNSARKIW